MRSDSQPRDPSGLGVNHIDATASHGDGTSEQQIGPVRKTRCGAALIASNTPDRTRMDPRGCLSGFFTHRSFARMHWRPARKSSQSLYRIALNGAIDEALAARRFPTGGDATGREESGCENFARILLAAWRRLQYN